MKYMFQSPTIKSHFTNLRYCYYYKLFKELEEHRRREGLTCQDTLAYTRAVKALFQDEQEKYAEFLQIMISYKTKRLDVEEVKSRIKELFKGEEVFILAFNIFLPCGCSKINTSLTSQSSKTQPSYESMGAKEFWDFIDGMLQHDPFKRNSFLDILNLYRKCGFSIESIFQEIEYLFKDEEQLLEAFRNYFQYSINSVTQDSSSPHVNQRHLSQHMAENKRQKISAHHTHLTKENCSYGRVMKNKRFQSLASGRTPLDNEVLNDEYKLIKSCGSSTENKYFSKNAEIMNEYEENRADMDVLIEIAKSTAKGVEEYLTMINSTEKRAIKDHFLAQHIRCIERLYGEHGLDVVVEMQKKELHVLPIILRRLKQKIEEWSKRCMDFNKNWVAENYHESLDPSSLLEARRQR